MAERLNHKYVIDEAHRLGRGGMGEVFAGWTMGAEGFSRPVAIKRIRDDYGDDEKFRSRFVREARLVARLSHTNIVTVFDFDRDEAVRLVAEYFGPIPRGPARPPVREMAVPPTFGETLRETVYDSVALPRLFVACRTPVFGSDG